MDEVKFYMDESIVSIDPTATASEAARKMRDNKIGSLMVDDDGEFVGIITEGDISRKVIANDGNPRDVKVSLIMSKPIISVDGDLSMAAVFLHMRENNIRHCAVTRGKQIVGIVSIKDFATYYINKFSKGAKDKKDNK